MYDDKEFLEYYEKQKACFEKEIEETRKMLKEVIGEENEGYYRISQMLRLIEFDYNELLEEVGDLAEAANEITKQFEKLKETEELVKQKLKEDHKEDISREKDIDVMSEIVKRINKLDAPNQRMALSYINGMVAVYEKMKRESNKTATKVRKYNKMIYN